MDKDNREKNIGIMEATFGLGMLLGPLIGGFMFSAFGFKGMFFCFVVVGFIMLPWTYYLLGGVKTQSWSDRNGLSPKEPVNLCLLLSKPRFTFAMIS